MPGALSSRFAQVVALGLLAALSRPAAATDLAAKARSLVGADQGVYVEAEDGSVLVAQAASRAVHPASVSKIPTTLALLRKLGSEHRFETRFGATGPLEGGVLRGQLVVEAGGDPFLVDENALLVLDALRALGLRRVEGGLVARGSLRFNWETAGAAARLRAALEGKVSPEAWRAVRAVRGGGAAPQGLAFGQQTPAREGAARLLVRHASEPLVPLVKALNGYSNNVFAPLAEAAGGAEAVQAVARASVAPELRTEIVLGDGAGADRRNRLSPRVAVALLRALGEELARGDRSLADVLPVAGVDPGTLEKRLDGPGERGRVVAKTGSYGSYGACALAGALRSRERGIVYFAVLNRGVPVEAARRRQDAFVRTLLEALPGEPWPYTRDLSPSFTRARVEQGSVSADAE